MAKRFIKAEMWLVLYLVVQSAVMLVVMLYRINADAEFASGLADTLLNNVYAESMQTEDEPTKYTIADNYALGSRITQSIKMAQSISAHLSPVLIPTCIISAAIIISVYLITRWDTVQCQVMSWTETTKYIVYALIANLVITLIIELLPQAITSTHQSSTDMALSGDFFLVLLSTGLLVPLMEEIIFRYGIGETIGGTSGLIYQAVVFGLLHGNPIQIVYAFVLGLWFGIANKRQGSLMPGIIMHITFNASTVMADALINVVTGVRGA